MIQDQVEQDKIKKKLKKLERLDTDEDQKLSSNSNLSAQYDTFHQRPHADDMMLLEDEEEKSPGERIIPNLFG